MDFSRIGSRSSGERAGKAQCLAALSLQDSDHNFEALFQRLKVIPPFGDEADPPFAAFLGNIHERPGHHPEAVGRHSHVRQRIALVCVETGRHEQDVWREGAHGWQYGLAERPLVDGIR
ncbi:MAG TPA: hypothetical protein VHZ73_11350 [Vicinamibacterales bacterium]|nr:hypothetical protein [Vicinamibacterales bacterium]